MTVVPSETEMPPVQPGTVIVQAETPPAMETLPVEETPPVQSEQVIVQAETPPAMETLPVEETPPVIYVTPVRPPMIYMPPQRPRKPDRN